MIKQRGIKAYLRLASHLSELLIGYPDKVVSLFQDNQDFTMTIYELSSMLQVNLDEFSGLLSEAKEFFLSLKNVDEVISFSTDLISQMEVQELINYQRVFSDVQLKLKELSKKIHASALYTLSDSSSLELEKILIDYQEVTDHILVTLHQAIHDKK